MDKKHFYYRVILQTESALSIGTADSLYTDHDVVLDSRGLPVIPATSIAGALRAYLPEDARSEVFGSLSGADSRVLVYDATHVGGNEAVSLRDSVSLEGKVAKKGLKFDRQVVERGAEFVLLLEVTDDAKIDGGTVCSYLEGCISALHSGAICLGSKTSRGMGRVKVADGKFQKAEFDFGDQKSLDAWLGFDPFDGKAWDKLAKPCKSVVECKAQDHDDVVITLGLKLVGSLLVREPMAEANTKGMQEAGLNVPDVRQLVVRTTVEGETSQPVIPGTTWAGAIRDRFCQLGGKNKKDVDWLFGTVFAGKHRSRLTVSETVIEGGSSKTVMRNAIDRFTGGTIESALFCEEVHYGGTTTLELRVSGIVASDAKRLAPLFATLADLHNGFLAVGGTTSVGRGLFKVTSAQMTAGGNAVQGFGTSCFPENGFSQPDVAAIVKALGEMLPAKTAKGV